MAVKYEGLLTLNRKQCVSSKGWPVSTLDAASYPRRIKSPCLLYEAVSMAGWVKETDVLSKTETSD